MSLIIHRGIQLLAIIFTLVSVCCVCESAAHTHVEKLGKTCARANGRQTKKISIDDDDDYDDDSRRCRRYRRQTEGRLLWGWLRGKVKHIFIYYLWWVICWILNYYLLRAITVNDNWQTDYEFKPDDCQFGSLRNRTMNCEEDVWCETGCASILNPKWNEMNE